MKALLVSVLALVFSVLCFPSAFTATHDYVDFDTVYVIYTHYDNGSTTASFSKSQIDTILSQIEALKYWCWRASNCMCNQQYDLTEYDPDTNPDGDLLIIRSDGEGGHTLRPGFNSSEPPPLDFNDCGAMGGGTQVSSENFQNGALDSWSNVGTFNWKINSDHTPTSKTGPSGNSPFGGDAYYAHLEADDADQSGDTAILQSPQISDAGHLRVLEFDYHMYGSNIGTLSVDVYSGGQWHEDVWSLNGQQHTGHDDVYKSAQVHLGDHSGTIRIRFRAVAAGGIHGDIAIDHIRVISGTRNILISDGRVAYDLKQAGIDPSDYSCVFAFYPFRPTSNYDTIFFGGTQGVNWTHPWGNGGFISLTLAQWDWSKALAGAMQFEWNNYLFSLFVESGLQTVQNPTVFPDPEVVHLCTYPIDSMWDFRFQSMNRVQPAQWLALDSKWAIDRHATDNDTDGIPDSGDFAFTDASLGTSGSDDYDNDGRDDQSEMVATFHDAANPHDDQDSDDDGMPDGEDPFPLYAANLNVEEGTPDLNGTIGTGEWTEVAQFETSDPNNLSATIYARWVNGTLYLATHVTDDQIRNSYTPPYAEGKNDLFQVLIDARQDGWYRLSTDRNYRFRFTPNGGGATGLVYGYDVDTVEHTPVPISTTGVEVAYGSSSGTYTIEAKIPASVIPGVTVADGSNVRIAFSFLDNDAHVTGYDVFTGHGTYMNDDNRGDNGFIVLKFTTGGDTTPPEPTR